MPYEKWKRCVDHYISKVLVGLDSECLPDYDYYSAYMSGDTPMTAAFAAIKAAKDF